MYYLIQHNIFADPRYDEIFTVLDKHQLPYEKVRFQPNSNVFDYHTKRKDIFVYGSVKLAKVSADYDWTPGSFYGGNHQFSNYAKGFGENLLNYPSQLCQLTDEIDWGTHETLFIKPSKDAKVFTGNLFNRHEWDDFVYESLNDPNNHRITENTLIQVSPAHFLHKEARLWIVNNQVVSSSYYRFHHTTPFAENVPDDAVSFVEKMADLFHVADAYVMDIGLTDTGWKIVEVNCINSAGFYKADIEKIVLALEDFYQNKL